MGEPERVYYIRYRRDGREFEEKVGRQFQDSMTPGRAVMIRSECIAGKRLPRKELKEREKREKVEKLRGKALAKETNRNVAHKQPQEILMDSGAMFRDFMETASDLMSVTDAEGYLVYGNVPLQRKVDRIIK